MIRSMLKQLQQGERDQSLLSFIDRAMKVEEHKKLLESHYSQELSLLYILQEDFDRAKYYIKRAMELFIEVRVLFFFFFFRTLSFTLVTNVHPVLSSHRVTPVWTRCSLKVGSPSFSQCSP